jgi:transcriptional regulator with XRE-family HTH domain
VDETATDAALSSRAEYSDLPAQDLTANQVVAWNMTHFRRAAALTQEELGELLGWSKAIVSAAERSWDGKRIRQFTVDDVAALARAFGIPLAALFLPPEDDGDKKRYVLRLTEKDAERLTMTDLTWLALTDNENESPVMNIYRNRLRGAVTTYLDEFWAEEVAGWLRQIDSDEARADRAARLRSRRAALLDLAAELADLADALEPDGEP